MSIAVVSYQNWPKLHSHTHNPWNKLRGKTHFCHDMTTTTMIKKKRPRYCLLYCLIVCAGMGTWHIPMLIWRRLKSNTGIFEDDKSVVVIWTHYRAILYGLCVCLYSPIDKAALVNNNKNSDLNNVSWLIKHHWIIRIGVIKALKHSQLVRWHTHTHDAAEHHICISNRHETRIYCIRWYMIVAADGDAGCVGIRHFERNDV